jgi:transcriptional regulator with XRE-family HTH domain
MEITKAFALVLREHRRKSELSQEKLAEESGFDRTYISLLERSRRTPTIKALFHLCWALNVEPSDFVEQIQSRCEKKKPTPSE